MPSPEIANTHAQIMQWLSARGLPPTTQNLNRAQLALISNPELTGSISAAGGRATSSEPAPSMDEMIDRNLKREQRSGRSSGPSNSGNNADDAPEERTNRSNQRGGVGSAAASGARSPMNAVDAIDASANADSAVKQSGVESSPSEDPWWLDPLAAGASAGTGWWAMNQFASDPATRVNPFPVGANPGMSDVLSSDPMLRGPSAMLEGPMMNTPEMGFYDPAVRGPTAEAMAAAIPPGTVMPNAMNVQPDPMAAAPQNATIQAILANRARAGALPAPAPRPPIPMPNPMATPNAIELPYQKPVVRVPAPSRPSQTEEDSPAKAVVKKRARTRAAARAVK